MNGPVSTNPAELRLFEEQVSYEDHLPFDLEPLSGTLSGPQINRLCQLNSVVLRAVGVLEDARSDVEDRASGIESDVGRLELKVNLLLELVGAVIAMQRPQPADVTLRLSRIGVAWTANGRLAGKGDLVMLSLFLHHCSAQPVQWPARIIETDEVDGGVRTWAAFEPMPELMLKHFERLVFRHHRRLVAQSRRESEPFGDPD